jgi:hypothetical protein
VISDISLAEKITSTLSQFKIHVGNRELAQSILEKNQYEYLMQENYRFPVCKEVKDVFGNDCLLGIKLVNETYELAADSVFWIHNPNKNEDIRAVGLQEAIDIRYQVMMDFLKNMNMIQIDEIDDNRLTELIEQTRLVEQQQVNSS